MAGGREDARQTKCQANKRRWTDFEVDPVIGSPNSFPTFLEEDSRCRDEEEDVGEHVDHAGPVDGRVADPVELGDDVGDDRVHDPLGPVGGGQQDEHDQHGPPAGEDPRLGQALALLLNEEAIVVWSKVRLTCLSRLIEATGLLNAATRPPPG